MYIYVYLYIYILLHLHLFKYILKYNHPNREFKAKFSSQKLFYNACSHYYLSKPISKSFFSLSSLIDGLACNLVHYLIL